MIKVPHELAVKYLMCGYIGKITTIYFYQLYIYYNNQHNEVLS